MCLLLYLLTVGSAAVVSALFVFPAAVGCRAGCRGRRSCSAHHSTPAPARTASGGIHSQRAVLQLKRSATRAPNRDGLQVYTGAGDDASMHGFLVEQVDWLVAQLVSSDSATAPRTAGMVHLPCPCPPSLRYSQIGYASLQGVH